MNLSVGNAQNGLSQPNKKLKDSHDCPASVANYKI